MLKEPLLDRAVEVLENNDYATCRFSGCFDIAAKREWILFLKVLQNVDALQIDQAKNLKIISNNLDAHPLIIGLQTRRERLQRGVVYERFELPTVSMETFEGLIANEILPTIYRDRGGLYVDIDSAVLREVRRKKGLTQRELAEAVGINKKAIYEHEKKELRMMLSIAQRIENVLERKIIKNIDVSKLRFEEHGKPEDRLEAVVGRDLKKLGFQTDFVKQAPFDVFAREKVLIISDVEENKRKMLRRVTNLRNFIDLAKRPAVVITEKSKEDELSGIPVVKRKELEEFESGEELIKIAKKVK